MGPSVKRGEGEKRGRTRRLPWYGEEVARENGEREEEGGEGQIKHFAAGAS